MLFELHNRAAYSAQSAQIVHRALSLLYRKGSKIKEFRALTFAWLERGNARPELGQSLLCSMTHLWRYLLKHLKGNETLWRVPPLSFFELGWTKMLCNYTEMVGERFIRQEIKMPLSKWLKIIFNSTITCWVDTSILASLYLTIIIPNYHSFRWMLSTSMETWSFPLMSCGGSFF